MPKRKREVSEDGSLLSRKKVRKKKSPAKKMSASVSEEAAIDDDSGLPEHLSNHNIEDEIKTNWFMFKKNVKIKRKKVKKLEDRAYILKKRPSGRPKPPKPPARMPAIRSCNVDIASSKETSPTKPRHWKKSFYKRTSFDPYREDVTPTVKVREKMTALEKFLISDSKAYPKEHIVEADTPSSQSRETPSSKISKEITPIEKGSDPGAILSEGGTPEHSLEDDTMSNPCENPPVQIRKAAYKQGSKLPEKSWFWIFFEDEKDLEDEGDEEKLAKCSICLKEISYIPYIKSNLVKHLRTSHARTFSGQLRNSMVSETTIKDKYSELSKNNWHTNFFYQVTKDLARCSICVAELKCSSKYRYLNKHLYHCHPYIFYESSKKFLVIQELSKLAETSWYWIFFQNEDSKDEDDEEKLAKCSICRGKFIYTSSSKANLLMHIKESHPDEYSEQFRRRKICKGEKSAWRSWHDNFFYRVDYYVAQCSICSRKVKFNGLKNFLVKHLESHHPFVTSPFSESTEEVQEEGALESYSDPDLEGETSDHFVEGGAGLKQSQEKRTLRKRKEERASEPCSDPKLEDETSDHFVEGDAGLKQSQEKRILRKRKEKRYSEPCSDPKLEDETSDHFVEGDAGLKQSQEKRTLRKRKEKRYSEPCSDPDLEGETSDHFVEGDAGSKQSQKKCTRKKRKEKRASEPCSDPDLEGETSDHFVESDAGLKQSQEKRTLRKRKEKRYSEACSDPDLEGETSDHFVEGDAGSKQSQKKCTRKKRKEERASEPCSDPKLEDETSDHFVEGDAGLKQSQEKRTLRKRKEKRYSEPCSDPDLEDETSDHFVEGDAGSKQSQKKCTRKKRKEKRASEPCSDPDLEGETSDHFVESDAGLKQSQEKRTLRKRKEKRYSEACSDPDLEGETSDHFVEDDAGSKQSQKKCTRKKRKKERASEPCSDPDLEGESSDPFVEGDAGSKQSQKKCTRKKRKEKVTEPKTKLNEKSWYWIFFKDEEKLKQEDEKSREEKLELEDKESKKKKLAKCSICLDEIRYSSSSKANLVKHLKKSHPNEFSKQFDSFQKTIIAAKEKKSKLCKTTWHGNFFYDEEEYIAKCSICLKDLKYTSCSKSHLIRHLKLCVPSVFSGPSKKIQEEKYSNSSSNTDTESESEHEDTASKQSQEGKDSKKSSNTVTGGESEHEDIASKQSQDGKDSKKSSNTDTGGESEHEDTASKQSWARPRRIPKIKCAAKNLWKWNFFKSQENNVAKCLLCHSKIKYTSRSTTNLIQHFKRSHLDAIPEPFEEFKKRSTLDKCILTGSQVEIPENFFEDDTQSDQNQEERIVKRRKKRTAVEKSSNPDKENETPENLVEDIASLQSQENPTNEEGKTSEICSNPDGKDENPEDCAESDDSSDKSQNKPKVIAVKGRGKLKLTFLDKKGRIWNFFKYVGNNTANCSICFSEISFDPTISTSNLVSHLTTFHLNIFSGSFPEFQKKSALEKYFLTSKKVEVPNELVDDAQSKQIQERVISKTRKGDKAFHFHANEMHKLQDIASPEKDPEWMPSKFMIGKFKKDGFKKSFKRGSTSKYKNAVHSSESNPGSKSSVRRNRKTNPENRGFFKRRKYLKSSVPKTGPKNTSSIKKRSVKSSVSKVSRQRKNIRTSVDQVNRAKEMSSLLSNISKDQLKKVVQTAIQFQRHCHSRKLCSSHFSKALAVHNFHFESDFSEDFQDFCTF